jgi:nucleotide-binding universal stress UspA family protein
LYRTKRTALAISSGIANRFGRIAVGVRACRGWACCAGGTLSWSLILEFHAMALVLACTDGSLAADRAIDKASEFARALSAKLLIVTIGDDRSSIEGLTSTAVGENLGDLLEAKARRIVDNAAARARTVTSQVEVYVGWGDVTGTILEVAKQHKAELIVVGRRGLGRLARLLMGSISQKITALADCPVIVVP